MIYKKDKAKKKKPIKPTYAYGYGGNSNGKMQEGGPLKPKVPEYKPNFPFTGDKPPAYPFEVYDKAVVRDSTQLSSFFGNITARPGIEQDLQINREYREKAKAAMKKGGKIKGVDVSSLTKKQQTTMKKHSVHHTKKHIKAMTDAMKKGATFMSSHKMAMKKIGK
jgi:anti-sigma28 factor (negative regulator of flagellin synthesis)